MCALKHIPGALKTFLVWKKHLKCLFCKLDAKSPSSWFPTEVGFVSKPQAIWSSSREISFCLLGTDGQCTPGVNSIAGNHAGMGTHSPRTVWDHVKSNLFVLPAFACTTG